MLLLLTTFTQLKCEHMARRGLLSKEITMTLYAFSI